MVQKKGNQMSLFREIGYCIDCHEVVYPITARVCPCNNKFMIIQSVDMETAMQIETYREKGFSSVKIKGGEIIASNGPDDQAVQSNAGDDNDAGQVAGD